MSSAALSEYRNIVRLLFRVVDPDHYKSKDLDALLDRIHDILQSPDSVKPMTFIEDVIRPPTPPTLIIHPDQKVEEVVPTVIVTKSEPEMKTVSVLAPTPSKPQNIVVNASKADAAIFRAIAEDSESDSESDSDSFVEPDLDSDSESEADESEAEESEAEEEEDEEEAESEAEEDEEEAEEDEEEAEENEEEYDEDRDGEMELMKIKKERYWVTSKNQKVFAYVDGSYGDCIGVFKDGKIVSPN